MFAPVLSRGSTWSMPSILAPPGSVWPTGGSASTYAIFTDTTGAVLAQVTGQINGDMIDFVGISNTVVDPIPAGANCEIFVTDTAGLPYKIRYGKVMRREVGFPNAPTTVVTPALQFSDSFQRTALGNNWVPLSGTTVIHNNASLSLPNGVSVYNQLFSDSAVRYYVPFNTDSVLVNVNVVNPLNLQAGKTGIICCADINFTTGLVMQFETGIVNNYIHMGILGAPTTVIYEGSATANTVHNGDNYSISFNNQTATLTVYKGTNLTPLATWVDTAGQIAHGPGYRYWGMNFEASLLTQGIQITSLAAMDYVG